MAYLLGSMNDLFTRQTLVLAMLVTVSVSLLSIISDTNIKSSFGQPLSNERHNIPLAIPVESQSYQGKISELGFTNYTVNRAANMLPETGFSNFLTCSEMPILSIAANGNDGNVPANANDKDLNTRWSNLGRGSWIQFDLGSKKSICNIDIAWHRGDTRQNNFQISVSDDGSTFENILTDTSSGSTNSLETYPIPSVEGRYVKITVNGNTENDWASISEIVITGSSESY